MSVHEWKAESTAELQTSGFLSQIQLCTNSQSFLSASVQVQLANILPPFFTLLSSMGPLHTVPAHLQQGFSCITLAILSSLLILSFLP